MIDVSQIRVPLDGDQVTDIYIGLRESDGKTSVGRVAQFLANHGILSPFTRRPFTRQAIHLIMLRSERGREALSYSSISPHRQSDT